MRGRLTSSHVGRPRTGAGSGLRRWSSHCAIAIASDDTAATIASKTTLPLGRGDGTSTFLFSLDSRDPFGFMCGRTFTAFDLGAGDERMQRVGVHPTIPTGAYDDRGELAGVVSALVADELDETRMPSPRRRRLPPPSDRRSLEWN
jgi:hypothetical protein